MPSFPRLSPDLMAERLAVPQGRVRLVIDTDTANEIDDQFALAWALLSPDRLDVQAVTAEPFSFAHHLPELQAAEAAMMSGRAGPEHLVGGFQGWLGRLQAQGPFQVLPRAVTTSARKYLDNGVFRLQAAFTLIAGLYWLGVPQPRLVGLYRWLIREGKL